MGQIDDKSLLRQRLFLYAREMSGMDEVADDLIAPVAASNAVMAPIGICAPTLTADEAVAATAKALEGFGDG